MHCLPSRHQLHIVVEAAFTSKLDPLACTYLLACLMHLQARNSPTARKCTSSKSIAMLYVSESLIGIAKSKKCAQIDM